MSTDMVNFSNAMITFQSGSVVINYNLIDLSPVLSAIADTQAKVDALSSLDNQILSNQGAEMAALDDLEMKVTQVQGVEASAATLLQTIHDELVAALAAGGSNVESRVQAVIDMLGQSSDALAAAVAANPDPNASAPPPPGP